MSFLDYSAAATGMTYRNNNNLAGVTIDGVADSVTAGPLTWESVDGAQGALTSVHTWSTTVAASKFTSFYRDLASPPAGQTPCQGDGGFYGASGPYVNGSINSTDEPANGSAAGRPPDLHAHACSSTLPARPTARCAASR